MGGLSQREGNEIFKKSGILGGKRYSGNVTRNSRFAQIK